jgi:hypothetical protein
VGVIAHSEDAMLDQRPNVEVTQCLLERSLDVALVRGETEQIARDEPFEEVVYDEPREGRPTELSDEQHEQFVEALHDSPEEVGYGAPARSVPFARHYLAEKFDVEYCERHVRQLMSEAGLSSRTARPEFDKSDERAQEAW